MPDEFEERLAETVDAITLQWQQVLEASGVDESDPAATLELYQRWAAVQIAALRMTVHEVVRIVEADQGIEIDEFTPAVNVEVVGPRQIKPDETIGTVRGYPLGKRRGPIDVSRTREEV